MDSQMAKENALAWIAAAPRYADVARMRTCRHRARRLPPQLPGLRRLWRTSRIYGTGTRSGLWSSSEAVERLERHQEALSVQFHLPPRRMFSSIPSHCVASGSAWS